MRTMKKLVSSILSLALVISMLYGFPMPSVKAAPSGECGPNLTWVLDKGTLTISGTGRMNDYYYDPDLEDGGVIYHHGITHAII